MHTCHINNLSEKQRKEQGDIDKIERSNYQLEIKNPIYMRLSKRSPYGN
ncbi:hypothetical Protein YC6258_01669 [Gynuella sunshinyii YC6258]|uniref:Uncharacterized protein n=1 Tax=Gynuella sunshinyii YC6258 TaxID=1445510 RepID=A0A0C5VGK1_9GAMM|nr:hypothetical Protein YC6258_01669 [Gynuella sunshinyii YC6258]